MGLPVIVRFAAAVLVLPLCPALGAEQGMQRLELQAVNAQAVGDVQQPGMGVRVQIVVGISNVQQQFQQWLQKRRTAAAGALERF